jgi:hypothetical protein
MERLEHAAVEHIVKARTRRHLETIGDRVNPLENLVGPIEPCSMLAAARSNKRFRWSVMQRKPNPLANLKRHLTMLVMVVELAALLCLEKAIMNILEEGVTICEQMLWLPSWPADSCSRKANCGAEITNRAPCSHHGGRARQATKLRRPRRNSTSKSYPSSLLT